MMTSLGSYPTFLSKLRRWLLACCGFSLMMTGCSGSAADKPINAGTFQVDIEVWRVLAPGDTAGDGANFGCRLTNQDISAIINKLVANGHIYGGSTRFNWNGQIRLIVNTYDQPQFEFRVKPVGSFELWLDDNTSVGFVTNRINIYFTGAYTFVGDMDFANGAAATDPSEGTASSIPFRKIVINDFGGGVSFGSNAATIIVSNVAEHEMAHYLARFRGRTLGVPPNTRMYGAPTEHTTSGNCILSTSAAPPLVIPGSVTTSGTEPYEI